MNGVITVPKQTITGAFTVLMTFIRDIELTVDDVVITTLEGDALGHAKDHFGGGGADYFMLCYLPDARSGQSRIAIRKAGIAVEPVVVTYDTVKTVVATWGTPIRHGSKIEIPVAFGAAIENLHKRNFTLSPPCPFQLYGTADAYSLVVPEKTAGEVFTVAVAGAVRKANGVRADIIQETLLEVDRGTLN